MASSDDVTVLGDTIMASLLDDTAAEVLEASGGVDVIDETDVLVISGTAHGKNIHIIGTSNSKQSTGNE